MTVGEIPCKGREECLRATGGRTTAVCFGASHSESSAKSRVVQLYANAFVHDRANPQDANLSECRIYVRLDPHMAHVDPTENLRVADLPNPSVRSAAANAPEERTPRDYRCLRDVDTEGSGEL